MMFRARLLDPDVSPGVESLEVKLVTEDEIPWDQLAFAMVRRTLAALPRGPQDRRSSFPASATSARRSGE